MTIASTTNRKTFAGDDATTSFGTSPVVFFSTSDLEVSVVDDTTGVETSLTENTHYTVSGGSGSTGTVSLAGGTSPHGALATGTTLVILRVMPFTQAVDFVNNDINDAEVLEDSLDKLTLLTQQLSEVDDRALKLSSTETTSTALTELPFDRASTYLGFNASKELVALGAPTSTAITTPYIETLLDDANAAAARTTLGLGTMATGDVATQADQETATSVTAGVTPGRQQFHPSAAKVWCKAGLTGNILASYNMTSVTDVGAGAITFTFATDFSSANWAGSVDVEYAANDKFPRMLSQAAGSCAGLYLDSAGSAGDPTTWSFIGFGDQA